MTRIRPFLAVAILPALVALVLACAAIAHACAPDNPPFHGPHYAASQVGAEVCFPFKLWSAPSIDRAPCYTFAHPEEDSSGRFYVGSVANDAAVCFIPNVYEERGSFKIQCRRIGGRNE